MKIANKKQHFQYQILIVDALIYLLTISISLFFFTKTMFFNTSKTPEHIALAIFLPSFILIATIIIATLTIEKKYNHFEFRKLYLILGAIIALINIIAICVLPSEISLPYCTEKFLITGIDRLYGILYGFIIAFLPLLFFYVLPRRFTNRKYLKVFLIFLLCVIFLSIIISFIKDFNCYYLTIKSKFADISHPVTSIFVHKNFFASFLLAGIILSIWLHVLYKNWRWLLAIIPLFIVQIFTFAKMTIFVSFILILAYLIYRIILCAKKNRDNLVITSLISAFLIIFITTFAILIYNSQSGILFNIKKAINSVLESAKSTLSSRLIIWDDVFKILMPFQYIFGFGFALVGNAIQATYAHDPRLPEDPSAIIHAHNSGVEMIAEGGIIYLLLNIFLYAYLIYIATKLRKQNNQILPITIIFIAIMLIQGITEPIFILGENFNIVFSIVIIVPVMSEYYRLIDESEMQNHKEIANKIKQMKNEKFTNLFLKINQKFYLIASRDIKKDSKIK